MIVLISAVGALGLLIAISSLPPLQERRLERRVEPYLSGLHGRPSRLLVRPRDPYERFASGPHARVLARLLPAAGAALDDRLRAAGDERSAAAFRAEQLIWGAMGALLLWTISGAALASGLGIDLRAVPVLTVISFAGGYTTRDWLLTRQIESRRARLQEELPMAIDLVTLSIMAGESVPAAFGRVAKHIPTGIGAEFDGVVADIRAGSPTIEALEALKDRLPIQGIGRFIDALCTAVERGAPLADVLRAQAEDGREARRRHLLEMGGRREVLMLVPVVFLIMPVVVVFALLPGLVALELLVP